MAYEDILIQESTGEGGGWSLDRTEATADWFDSRDEENSGEDVCVPASPEPDFRSEPLVGSGSAKLDRGERLHASATEGSTPSTSDQSFSTWLEKHDDHLHLPTSFSEWLNRTQDTV